MSKYLMEIYRYFTGYESFVIEALDKADAICKAKIYISNNPGHFNGNYNINDIRCVKKLKK